MRRFTVLFLIVAVILMTVASVSPASASPGGTTTNGLLVKTKTLKTGYVRTWDWNIAKSGSVDTLVLAINESALVDYTVTVTGTAVDSGWTASGRIGIRNMTAAPITINSVVINITGGIIVTPTCVPSNSFPQVLGAGNIVECSYSTALPDGSPRTATAIIDSSVGIATDSDFITFGAPTSVTGQTVSVFDSMAGDLGTVTATTNPTVKVFTYTKQIGPYGACGNYKAANTAKLVGLHKTASWIIKVNVPCQ